MGYSLHPESNERRSGDRRQRRVSIVLHERRTGFDRRAVDAGVVSGGLEGVLRALRRRPGHLTVMMVAINVLNLADYLLTLGCLANGGGEANPLMAALFDSSPVYAGFFKLSAVLGVTLILWLFRRHRTAILATLVILAGFLGLYVYHMVGLAFLS